MLTGRRVIVGSHTPSMPISRSLSRPPTPQPQFFWLNAFWLLADISAGVESVKGQYLLLLVLVLAGAGLAGCTSSAPAETNQTAAGRDAYTAAYYTAMDHHYTAECYFNNGTAAWESGDFRQAISDYANSSMEYDAAAANYEAMGRYGSDDSEKSFSDGLRKCSVNLSKAATDFMESAIALLANDEGKAYSLFNQGQDEVTASDALLLTALNQTPGWLKNASAGNATG